MNEKDIIIPELNSETIESMIYIIRGVKVMLDYDLAKIYGYTTKAFNQQVQRNISKFPERYRFKLFKDEIKNISRSHFVTMNDKEDNRGYNFKYMPYAFTEQGIYMLMTVLNGELATKQSIILIDTFKQMKDYIVECDNMVSSSELLKLINEQNDKFVKKDDFEKFKKDTNKIKANLSKVMDYFVDNNYKNHYVFFKGDRIDADVFYQGLFLKAKHSIIIIDNYIDFKTLLLLKCVNKKASITILTDNKGTNDLNNIFVDDFKKDTNINLIIKENKELHDRYIAIDLNYKKEELYHLGPSIKDTGNNGGAINRVLDVNIYRDIINNMLNNKTLEL